MSREVNSKKALFIKLILMAVLQLLLKLPGTIHPKLVSWVDSYFTKSQNRQRQQVSFSS